MPEDSTYHLKGSNLDTGRFMDFGFSRSVQETRVKPILESDEKATFDFSRGDGDGKPEPDDAERSEADASATDEAAKSETDEAKNEASESANYVEAEGSFDFVAVERYSDSSAELENKLFEDSSENEDDFFIL